MTHTVAHEPLNLGRKLTEQVLDPMKQAFVGKDEVIDLLGACLVARENLFIMGPPGSAPNTRTRVAIALRQGGIVYWDDFERGHTEAFAADMSMPVVGLNRGGYLIAASEDICQVYGTQSRRIQWVADMPSTRCPPLTVLSSRRSDQFAIATAEGEIVIYEIE